jgi:hypothetical protein
LMPRAAGSRGRGASFAKAGTGFARNTMRL